MITQFSSTFTLVGFASQSQMNFVTVNYSMSSHLPLGIVEAERLNNLSFCLE